MPVSSLGTPEYMTTEYPFIPLHDYPIVQPENGLQEAQTFYHKMNKRRSVRDISDKPVDAAIIDTIIQTASTAPSGANKQPWTFCVVSNAELKQKIREAAEAEEKEAYESRMNEEWLKDLAPLGTDDVKPFLTKAPYLIVVFKQTFGLDKEGNRKQHYYVQESVGLACGFLLAAIHQAGLVSLTHTPSPMNFLQDLLGRPKNEKPFLLIPVGYPEEGATVPDIQRKPLEEVAVYYR